MGADRASVRAWLARMGREYTARRKFSQRSGMVRRSSQTHPLAPPLWVIRTRSQDWPSRATRARAACKPVAPRIDQREPSKSSTSDEARRGEPLHAATPVPIKQSTSSPARQSTWPNRAHAATAQHAPLIQRRSKSQSAIRERPTG